MQCTLHLDSLLFPLKNPFVPGPRFFCFYLVSKMLTITQEKKWYYLWWQMFLNIWKDNAVFFRSMLYRILFRISNAVCSHSIFKKNYTTYIKPSILYTIDRLCNAQYVDELHIIIKQYILYTLQKTIIYF